MAQSLDIESSLPPLDLAAPEPVEVLPGPIDEATHRLIAGWGCTRCGATGVQLRPDGFVQTSGHSRPLVWRAMACPDCVKGPTT